MTLCVIGLGRVGLPTALLLAQHHDVVGVDVDEAHVAALNRGEIPPDEPGLDTLAAEVADSFSASTEVPADADTYVVVTPTPLDAGTDVADLTYVSAAAEAVRPVLNPGDLVVLESTVPPGTTARLVAPILERGDRSVGEFHLAHCPERAIPGRALTEMVENSRVVGGLTPEGTERAAALYESFVEGTVHRTDATTAEFVKLMENTYRDTNIALANEFAKMAEELGVSVHEGIGLANEHPRVDVHTPGPGVGGHCITIDPQFLAQASAHDRLVSMARSVNDSMAKHVASLVQGATDRPEATVTLLGVAYKGDVGDTRETPALPIASLLRNVGRTVRAHDPFVDPEAFPVDLEPLDAAVTDADCLLVVTDHTEFHDIDPERVAGLMRGRTVVDTRAVLDREAWEAAGFDVTVLGDGRDQ
jgi:UDP-N-acetyl-D-mannosaminuronic acid dehydrogenase